jgi:hypothetical protein
MTPDVINALFEFGAGLMCLINIRRLHIDKEVRGYSKWVFAFFTTWGMWNLYYYPHLGQWWSFWGGLSICSTNFIWLGMAIYYGRKDDSEKTTDSCCNG